MEMKRIAKADTTRIDICMSWHDDDDDDDVMCSCHKGERKVSKDLVSIKCAKSGKGRKSNPLSKESKAVF